MRWMLPWPEWEEQKLRELAKTKNTEEIAQELGRTEEAVRGRLGKLKLHAVPKHRWANRKFWRSSNPVAPKSREQLRREARERMAALRAERKQNVYA